MITKNPVDSHAINIGKSVPKFNVSPSQEHEGSDSGMLTP